MAEKIISKRCSKCKQIKPLTKFYKRNDRPCGFTSECKTCLKKRNKPYYKKYVKLHPNKCNARSRVKYAIKVKRLPKAKLLKCLYCSRQAEHYHHPDYSKPLDVEPVCRSCHYKIHR